MSQVWGPAGPRLSKISVCICTMSQYGILKPYTDPKKGWHPSLYLYHVTVFQTLSRKSCKPEMPLCISKLVLHHEKTRNTISNWKNGIRAEPNHIYIYIFFSDIPCKTKTMNMSSFSMACTQVLCSRASLHKFR